MARVREAEAEAEDEAVVTEEVILELVQKKRGKNLIGFVTGVASAF